MDLSTSSNKSGETLSLSSQVAEAQPCFELLRAMLESWHASACAPKGLTSDSTKEGALASSLPRDCGASQQKDKKSLAGLFDLFSSSSPKSGSVRGQQQEQDNRRHRLRSQTTWGADM